MFRSRRSAAKIREILPRATVVDVRTAAEYKNGHYSGALNIPVDKIVKSAGKLGDKNSPKILYCASGARARQAARLMKSMGFSSVYVAGTLAQIQRPQ
jgi:phage shock protein E